MNNHKNKCFTLELHLSEPKFAKIRQILQKIALTPSIGQNSINTCVLVVKKKS